MLIIFNYANGIEERIIYAYILIKDYENAYKATKEGLSRQPENIELNKYQLKLKQFTNN